MSDGYGRMDKEEFENEITFDGEEEFLNEILKDDEETGRKKADLSFLEDETLYFSDEQEEQNDWQKETEEDIIKTKKKKGYFKNLSKKKKIVLSVFIIFISFIFLVVAVVGIYILSKLAKINFIDEQSKTTTEYQDPDYGEIIFEEGSEGFRQALKDWATTGNNSIMDNDNVINVLLIGADSRSGTNSGNTDVIMIVSLNKETKEIKLVSLFRDSYIYVEGINRQDFTKLNAAFAMGGSDCLVKTVENNFKIDIDNYVMVNFESFARIVDAMGGLNLDITQAESDHSYKKMGVSLPVGKNVILNGEQVVCYCRIRQIYSSGDVKRTENQRIVIEKIIEKVKVASLGDLDKYIDILFPEIYTDFSQSEVLSLGIEALTNGWVNYSRKQVSFSDSKYVQGGTANMWIWVADYPMIAHDLQIELYGESNITLDPDRTTFIQLYNEGQSSQSDNSSGGDSESEEPVPVTDISEPVEGEEIGVEDIPPDEEGEIIQGEPIEGETESEPVSDVTKEETDTGDEETEETEPVDPNAGTSGDTSEEEILGDDGESV